jgi:hypothetical protein
MPITYHNHGLRFLYPENWLLEEEDTENGWSVALQSPNTPFLLLSCHRDDPTSEQVLNTVLEALKADYPGLEFEDRVDTLAGQPAAGLEIRFISLDLTNTCCARCLYTDEGTLLVIWQGADLDLETTEPVLRAICQSLELDDA